jgi:hypothetical protein
MTLTVLIRKPTAWLPMAMSLTAIAVLIVALATGAGREPDEGWAAHLFQLLIVLQLPLMAAFALRWWKAAPQPAIAVLLVQTVCMVAAWLPVYLLHL